METIVKKKGKGSDLFERIANKITLFTGSSVAFSCAAGAIIIWAMCGPFFEFPETWQLVINTGTTIITFLMVFIIQKTQNKDSKTVHLKLNELIASLEGSSNRIADAEDLSEKELDQLQRYYVKLSQLAKKDTDLLESHSIDAALKNNEEKVKVQKSKHTSIIKTPSQK